VRNVVFIPSQLLTADLWAPQIAALKGKAESQVANNSGFDTIAALAAGVLEAAPKSFVLTAHGMGGFIAFEILRRQPERVEKLVLVSTVASADTPAQTARRMGYLKLVEAGEFAKVVDERIPMMIPPERRGDAALTALVRKMAADTGAEAFLRQQKAIMGRIDSRPSLEKIRCPTLLVYGRHDGITTLDHQQEMLTGIKNARLEIVEDSGHLVPIERPERMNTLLGNWVGASSS
jgi:pimeloyl-ACP methyl ester carboxylesterase